jgi:hypothetical protein
MSAAYVGTKVHGLMAALRLFLAGPGDLRHCHPRNSEEETAEAWRRQAADVSVPDGPARFQRTVRSQLRSRLIV